MSTKLDSQNIWEDLEGFRELIEQFDQGIEIGDLLIGDYRVAKMRIDQSRKLLRVFSKVNEHCDDLNELRQLRNSIREVISGLNIFLSQISFDDNKNIYLNRGEDVMDKLFNIFKSVSEKINDLLALEGDEFEEVDVENDQNDFDIEKIGSDFLRIDIVKLEQLFVPTSGEISISTEGRGDEKFEKFKYINRLSFVYEVLQELGVKKCMLFEGCNHPSMMRELSYQMIVVPELSRVILVCEEEGNRTFVRKGINNLPSLYRSSKDELKNNPNVKNLIWGDSKNWKKLLKDFLTDSFDEESVSKDIDYTSRDENYYRNSEMVKRELDGFAQQLGLESFTDLTTSNRHTRKKVRCLNGEELFFRKYLAKAGIALGMVANANDAYSMTSHILNELLRIASNEDPLLNEKFSEDFLRYIEDKQKKKELSPRDDVYYSDSEKVRADLDDFVKQYDLGSPLELSTSDTVISNKITCSNGDELSFETYLRHAGFALGMAGSVTEAQSILPSIIKKLLKIAGYELRDEEYYTDSKKVKKDLDELAKQCGLINPVGLTSSGRFISKRMKCVNGETVTFEIYVRHATVAFGISENFRDAASFRSRVIKELVIIAGYEFRDEAYYLNPKTIKSDLDGLVKRCELANPFCLNTSHVSEFINCSNGEIIKFGNYLDNAGIALGLAQGSVEANSIRTDIIKELLKIAGYEFRDFDYYSNSEKVKIDLIRFAEENGLDSPFQINASQKLVGAEINCINGEKITFRQYLRHAALALEVVKETKNAGSVLLKMIKMLLKISGLKIRDEEYYRNSRIVRKDLEEFAKQFGLESYSELNVSTQYTRQYMKCTNGEKLKFRTYLSNAGVALGMASGSVKAGNMQGAILKELLIIAGDEEIESIDCMHSNGDQDDLEEDSSQVHCEFIPRDERYYKNPKIVLRDLESYAREAGVDCPLSLSTDKKFRIIAINCFNGERIKFNRYILNAGIVLGLAKNTKEASSNSSAILNELVKIAGYEFRDTEYYKSEKKVRQDLENYAKEAKLDTPKKLTTYPKYSNLTVKCFNQEDVKFLTYIFNAGVALGFGNNISEARRHLALILNRLLEIAGYEIKNYAPRDAAYYRNPDIVKKDLEEFARKTELETPLQLSTISTYMRTSINCSNGEKIKFQRYLSNAGVALGLFAKSREAGSQLSFILKKLLEIAGYEE
ncbi:hypothetical protein ACFL21_01710 [Patescibacteria group bacterium]